MFSKQNFIVAINTDTILKIRNVKGQIVHLIKEPTCTVSVVTHTVYIKQAAESVRIPLIFGSALEAHDAHIILRDNLKQLGINQAGILVPQVPVPFSTQVIIPPLTVVGVDQTFNAGVVYNSIASLYVNGVLIDPTWYTYTVTPADITWLGIADYNLDPATDKVMIHYD